MMRIPEKDVAEQYLREAGACNPGPWVDHSRYVAHAAQRIAAHIPGLNQEAAYILGLLHDIGRQAGVSDMRHVIDGYHLMMAYGYSSVARICLTHSFPLKDIRCMAGNWDGTVEDAAFLRDYLNQISYDTYDRLIQLCDALALPDGFCLIEKRMIDVALRRGINDCTPAKWQATFDIQHSFEQQIGHSIYALLPGVMENTFEMKLEKK
jgi:hypothetical protein